MVHFCCVRYDVSVSVQNNSVCGRVRYPSVPHFLYIIIIIIIIVVVVSFMQGIYAYIPETNYVPREYSVAAILLLLFMVLISLVSVLNLLYFYISTFGSMCALPSMAVFCSSLTSWFPGMLLTYFLNDFDILPVAPIITGVAFVFTFHMRCISIVRSLYFRIFSASFLITLLLLLLFTGLFFAHNQAPQMNYRADVSPHISVYSSYAL